MTSVGEFCTFATKIVLRYTLYVLRLANARLQRTELMYNEEYETYNVKRITYNV